MKKYVIVETMPTGGDPICFGNLSAEELAIMLVYISERFPEISFKVKEDTQK